MQSQVKGIFTLVSAMTVSWSGTLTGFQETRVEGETLKSWAIMVTFEPRQTLKLAKAKSQPLLHWELTWEVCREMVRRRSKRAVIILGFMKNNIM